MAKPNKHAPWESAEAFRAQVASHRLTVERDDGQYRHLKFRRTDRGSQEWFDLVTWPGTLCIHGGWGTFVFSRIPDMFEFFRSPKEGINKSYWAEKCDAADKGRGVRQWSPEKFTAAVVYDIREYFRDRSKAEQLACFREARDQVLSQAEDEHAACAATYDFKSEGFRFQDFWEHNLQEYTIGFTWCLRAIVWGINQYDAAKTPAEEPANA